MNNSQPKFTAIAVMSLDGITSPDPTKGVDWSSREDQEWFQKILPTFDAAIMGKKTYDLLPKPLTKRNRLVLTHSVSSIEEQDECTWFINPDATDLIDFLREKEWKNIGLLGGCETYTSFIEKYRIDELWLTVEPIVFGKGTRLFSGNFPMEYFQLKSLEKLNGQGTLLLNYGKVDSR